MRQKANIRKASLAKSELVLLETGARSGGRRGIVMGGVSGDGSRDGAAGMERGEEIGFGNDALQLILGREDEQHVVAVLIHEETQGFLEGTIGRDANDARIGDIADAGFGPFFRRDFAE